MDAFRKQQSATHFVQHEPTQLKQPVPVPVPAVIAEVGSRNARGYLGGRQKAKYLDLCAPRTKDN